MSTHRTRLAAAAAVLALAAPLSSISVPAQAVGEQRTITINGSEPRPNVFFINGRITPDYANRPATVQRRIGRTGPWNPYERFRTNDSARYKERVRPLRRVGRVYYRVKVNASDGFSKSFSNAIFIRTFRR